MNDLESHPTSEDELFGATLFPRGAEEGIYHSLDGGKTWNQITSLSTKQINILIDQDEPNRMYAYGGIYAGIWRTEDGGTSWVDITYYPDTQDTMPSIMAASINYEDKSLWISPQYEGVLVSYNHGDTWTKVNAGLMPLDNISGDPICESMSISSAGHFAIVCYGRVFYRIERKSSFLPIIYQ